MCCECERSQNIQAVCTFDVLNKKSRLCVCVCFQMVERISNW